MANTGPGINRGVRGRCPGVWLRRTGGSTCAYRGDSFPIAALSVCVSVCVTKWQFRSVAISYIYRKGANGCRRYRADLPSPTTQTTENNRDTSPRAHTESRRACSHRATTHYEPTRSRAEPGATVHTTHHDSPEERACSHRAHTHTRDASTRSCRACSHSPSH